MKSFLVPLDGSELAERALEPAMRLADRLDATVHLASAVVDVVAPVALPAEAIGKAADWLHEEEKRARDYLEGVRTRLVTRWSDRSVQTHVGIGPAPSTLRSIAAEVSADLIVLTTHGRGAWERFWLGSVADRLVRRSTVPLLLLRADGDSESLFASDGSPAHVIVPLDGSEAGEAALPVLRELLPRAGSRATLISVAHRPLLPYSAYLPDATWQEAMFEKAKEDLRAYLGGAKERFGEAGFEAVESRLAEGAEIARTLIDAVEDSGADLLALSTEGRGAVERFFVGSVADKLIRGCHVPVLVARRPDAGG